MLIEHSFATADNGQIISMVDAYFAVASLPGTKPSAEAPGVQRPAVPIAEAVLPGFAWSHNPIAFRDEGTAAPVVDWSAAVGGLPQPDGDGQDSNDHWLMDFLGASTGSKKADLAKLTGLKFKVDVGKMTKLH